MATPIIPIKNLSTQDVLYGDRTTRYRWEVLEHPPVRRNLIKNPSGRVNTVGYQTTGAGTALTLEAGRDTYAATNTSGIAPGNFAILPSVLTIGVDIEPNTDYIFSAAVYASSGGAIAVPWLYVTGGAGGSVGSQQFPAASGFVRRQVSFRTGYEGTVYVYIFNGFTTVSGLNLIAYQDGNIELASTFNPAAPYLDGTKPASYFEGAAHNSPSFSVPITDTLLGTLDGVSDGSLTWTQNAQVKGGGKAQVIDLEAAQAGSLRIADLSLTSVRLRPVCVIEGLPENPLGIFLLSSATEEWEDTGRVWNLSLLDRCTVPAQDVVDQSYSVAAGTVILKEVQRILATSGEHMTIDESQTKATSNGMVWEAGTSKLKIINDLLDVAGYNSLWMDGWGHFQATPRVLPADRSISYEVLGVPRELRDGDKSIYQPDWSLDRDSFDVPNKVLAVQAAEGEDAAALVGVWTNTDPTSPYSYQARGRWIPHVVDEVETPAGSAAETLAFLQKRAQTTLVQMSAVQATIKVTHLPIPVRVSDVLRFSHTEAGVDGRHVITRIELDTSALGMMKSTLQEVISL